MRVTSLIENRENPDFPRLRAEFGLSIHVVHGGSEILFDTGSTGAITQNARELGIDLEAVDYAVLSHHHFDHGGGLAAFLELNSRASVYLKHPVDGAPHARLFGLLSRYIGIDTSLFERFAERLAFVERFTEIATGVFLIPDIVSNCPRPAGNRHLFLKTTQGWKRDDFDHELILALKDTDGIVVFTGCSHSGILNMIETVADWFPDDPVKAVIGGFHLIGLPPFGIGGPSKETVTDLGRQMLSYPDASYHTGHCTGQRAFRTLRAVMGERLESFATGTVFDV